MRKTILYMDNHPDEELINQLKYSDYRVLVAQTVEKAKSLAAQHCVHLAIFDMRMIDDTDKNDVSGLEAVENKVFDGIPKIMWSGFFSDLNIEQANPYLWRYGIVASESREPEQAKSWLPDLVDAKFEKYVQINQDLNIRFQSGDSFAYLLACLDTECGLEMPVEELNLQLWSIWTKLFYEYQQIVIGEVWWRGKGWLIVSVTALDADGFDSQFFVFLGERSLAEAEYEKFTKYKPGNGRPEQTRAQASTTRKFFSASPNGYYFDASPNFAATAYELIGDDVRNLKPLERYYWQVEELQPMVDQLLKQTLLPHGGRPLVENGRKATSFCYNHYNLPDNWLSFQRHLATLCQHSSQLAPSFTFQLVLRKDTLQLLLPNGDYRDLPNPLSVLAKGNVVIPGRIRYGLIHGNLDSFSFAVNRWGQTWVANHLYTDIGPSVCTFVLLELAIKFEFTDTENIQVRQALEEALLTSNKDQLSLKNGGSLSKAFDAVLSLRRMADQAGVNNPDEYLYVLLLATMGYLLKYDATLPYTRNELIRFTHALLSASLLCEKLKIEPPAPKEEDEVPIQCLESVGIRDYDTREIYIEGQGDFISETAFKLLELFLEKEGHVLHYEQLSRVIEPDLPPNVERVHSEVYRLRNILRKLTSGHNYIDNVRGQGYSFKHNPNWLRISDKVVDA